MTYADLELSLQHWVGDDYAIALRLTLASSAVDVELIKGPLPHIHLPLKELQEMVLDPQAYGQHLTAIFFSDTRLREAFTKARIHAQTAQLPLRLRLRLDANDDAIHSIRWETLQDPEQGHFLSISERLLLSRYLDSDDMTPLAIRPRTCVTAVIAIASPTNLAEYHLDPIDVAGEIERSRIAFGDIQTTVFARAEHYRPPTWNVMAEALRNGPDIFYLVCHGTMQRGRSYLWLEQDDGLIVRIEGDNFIERITSLTRRPPLVVLSVCQSAGSSHDEGVLAALGPRLTQAGITAVVAMQGNIRVDTMSTFMPTFFRELRRDGQVDRAIAAARSAIINQPDWWMPVLFMRVRDGRIWSEGTELVHVPYPPPIQRPPKVTNFVGRETELAAFAHDLATEHVAIITGMAGVGKSTLATVLAERIGDLDKVFWYSFTGPCGIEIIFKKLGAFLAHHGQRQFWNILHRGGEPQPPELLLDDLIPMLRGYGYLIWLDNFHWVNDDLRFKEFIERLKVELSDGALSLLITSRRSPSFGSLKETRLTGLRIDEAHSLLATSGLALSVELIAKLRDAVVGNPKLLTLAAGLLLNRPDPARLIDRLANAPNIKKFLMDEVDKSLDEDKRAVMIAVAVLLGEPGTRDAIQAIVDRTNIDLERTFNDLSSHDLLTESDGEDDIEEGKYATEYIQHAIVQEFYYDRPNALDRQSMHRRVGTYYETKERHKLRAARHFMLAADTAHAAELATENVMAMINAGQGRQLVQLLEQLAKRQRASERDDEKHLSADLWGAVQVAQARVYHYIGETALAGQVSDLAFAYLATLHPTSTVRKLQATVCIDMGRWLRNQSPKVALGWLEQGLKAVTDAKLPEQAAELHNLIGSAQIVLGDSEAATHAIVQALNILPADAVQLRAAVLINQGYLAYQQGSFGQAKNSWQQALALSEQMNDIFRIVTILGNLGSLRDTIGDWAGAAGDYLEALTKAERLGIHVQRVRLGLNLGLLEINRGNHQTALKYLRNSLKLARQYGVAREQELGCLSGLLDLHLRRREVEQAVPLFAEIEQMVQETAFSYRRAEICRRWAEVYLIREDPKTALAYTERALEIDRTTGEHYDEGLSLRTKGQALFAANQIAAALIALEQSVALLAEDPYESARTKMHQGLAICKDGDSLRGIDLLHEARATFERMGAQRDLAEIDSIIGSTGENLL